MSKVDIALLKKLRSITNAPIKDCKSALIEANWDIDMAQDVLRKSWALKAAKKADRDTNEWIVKVKKEWEVVVWVKLACETDFVAKNEQFVSFADKILDFLISLDRNVNSIEDLSDEEMENINNIVAEAVSVVWENVKVVDLFRKIDKQSYIYEHPGNKIVWIVSYISTDNNADEIAKELALQAVAMNPDYIKMEDIPTEEYEARKKEFIEEVVASWKPAEIAEKIVQWKLNKYFSWLVLLEQPWIRDESKKVKSLMSKDFELIDIVRYSI